MYKLIFTVACLFLLGSTTLTAQLITISVEGGKQGKFKGESLKAKLNDKTELLGFLSEITSPRDIASGQATGRRQHQPVTILKATGISSPQFVAALVNNEVLKKVVIEFYRVNPAPGANTGSESVYYTVVLENVIVSGYKQYVGPLENERFNPSNMVLSEEIKLTYQRITVTDTGSGVTAQDDTANR
jgi:type VI secretion system secreted protein Hcp